MASRNRATDVDSTIELYQQFKVRIALIRLDGQESGTGFLVEEKLLLTAQHVVEASAGVIADPRSIQVTFDFWRRPDKTYAEAGSPVPVAGVVAHSPPTDRERSTKWDVDREAPAECLDYALVQLGRRPFMWSDGQFRLRSHYPIHFDSYDIARDQVLVLGHHPYGEWLKNSPLIFTELNHNKTRIIYKGKTGYGSSGGVIVDEDGRLVGLHHFASRTEKHGVPVTAIAQDLKAKKLDYVVEQNVAHLGRYSTQAKKQICQAIAGDWRSLSAHLGIPGFVTSADALWDWLSANKKLRKLREGLVATGRAELVQILDDDIVIVDQATIEYIRDLADLLVESAESAQLPSNYLRSAMGVRSLARTLTEEIKLLRSVPDDERAELQWRRSWRRQLGCAINELERLMRLLPSTVADASFARLHLKNMMRAAYGVKATVEKLDDLTDSPELLAK